MSEPVQNYGSTQRDPLFFEEFDVSTITIHEFTPLFQVIAHGTRTFTFEFLQKNC